MKTKILIFIKQNLYKVVVTAVAILALTLSVKECHNKNIAQKELQVSQQNVAALNDTIHIVKTKDGKAEADKFAFLTNTITGLQKLNADLANEVKNTNGKITTIIKGTVQIVHDTTTLVVNSTVRDSIVFSNFGFDTVYSKGNYRNVAGTVQYDLKTGKSLGKLNTDRIGMTFTTGIKDLAIGKPRIFLRSDYPGFVVDSLSGADIDPTLFNPKTKQHLITIGLNLGYVPITYSLSTKKLDVDVTRFGASIGMNINLLRLLKK